MGNTLHEMGKDLLGVTWPEDATGKPRRRFKVAGISTREHLLRLCPFLSCCSSQVLIRCTLKGRRVAWECLSGVGAPCWPLLPATVTPIIATVITAGFPPLAALSIVAICLGISWSPAEVSSMVDGRLVSAVRRARVFPLRYWSSEVKDGMESSRSHLNFRGLTHSPLQFLMYRNPSSENNKTTPLRYSITISVIFPLINNYYPWYYYNSKLLLIYKFYLNIYYLK